MPAIIIGVDEPPHAIDEGTFIPEIRQVLRNTRTGQLIVCAAYFTGDEGADFVRKVMSCKLGAASGNKDSRAASSAQEIVG